MNQYEEIIRGKGLFAHACRSEARKTGVIGFSLRQHWLEACSTKSSLSL